MTVERILEDAIETVKQGWTQGHMAVDAEWHDVDPTDSSACRRCLVGALRKAVVDNGGTVSLVEDSSFTRMASTMKNIAGTERMSVWNDDKDRTQEDVVNLLKSVKLLQMVR